MSMEPHRPVASGDVIIRPIDIDRDAERLAAMWNASDLQWPGSWTDGSPITVEMVRDWEEEVRHLVTYVAEVDGEIAGYCSFSSEHGRQSGEGYLALLNVHPGYQKRSIGRRLIQATIERSVQEGFQRQTLGTWSANFKAVPTYKKTGHFWTPDTSVWMQNFIPGALQLSLAKPFFERHDWYTTYVRALEQGEDDERWEGLKVFTQHWEADGESLTIWVDREARAPVAVETDALQVAAIAQDIEPLAGSEMTIRWRVVNRGAEPVSAHLHALGDKGVQIDHRDAFTVAPGATVERSAPVKIADDASSSKDDGTAPAVRSILRLGDDEVELFSGLRVRKPLSLDTAPEAVTAAPGRTTTVRLQLHSELDREQAVILRLTPPEGLELGWTQTRVQVPAKGHVAVPLTCTMDAEGAYVLPVRCIPEGREDKAWGETQTLFCLGVGGLLAHRQGGSARIETDALRITAQAKGGSIKVEHKATQKTLTELSPVVGPPYWPSQFSKQEFNLNLEQRGGRALVRLEGEAQRDKGLHLLMDLAVSGAGVLTMEALLENRGAQEVRRSLRFGLNKPTEEGVMALPLREGVVAGASAAYPIVWDDAPRDPDSYAEPWLAWERRGTVAGVAWNEQIGQIVSEWNLSLGSRELSVPPGARSEALRLMVYGGDGDWTVVRQAALRWRGEPLDADRVTSQPAYWVTAEPATALTVDDHVSLELVARSGSVRPERGQMRVELPAGVHAARTTWPVEELRRGQPRRETLTLGVGAPGAYPGKVALDLVLQRHEAPFHVLRLGAATPVEVRKEEREGHEVWAIDNGQARLVVAPGFGPSLIAWEDARSPKAANLLWSPFPERAGLAWHYPWFGGIQPVALPADSWCWEGYLYREQVEAEAVTVPDGAGLPWRGVRVRVHPEKKELHDLLFEIDWLTLGEADLLKMIYRVRNLRPTAQRLRVGSDMAFRLGGEATDLVMHGEGIHRKPTPWATHFEGRRWGALSHPGNGQAVLAVSNHDDLLLMDAGQYGRLLGSMGEVRLAGDETREMVYHVVRADSLEQAMAYLPLRDLP